MDEKRLETMFHDHLVKTRALLDYEKSLFCHVAKLEFFQKGDPSLEIMFDNHLGKNRALLDYKKSLFLQVAIFEFFQTRDPMNLVQN